jgi:hypothetical protein
MSENDPVLQAMLLAMEICIFEIPVGFGMVDGGG